MSASLWRIWAVCQKEFIQLRRDRLTFGMVIMIPLIQLLLFGYTINTNIRDVPITVVDQAENSFSRQLIMDIQATQVVVVKQQMNTPEEMMESIRNGSSAAGLFIPRDAEQRLYSGTGEPVAQLVVDGSDTVLAGALKSLGSMPFQPGAVISLAELNPLISVQLLYNPEQRSELFTVPGLLGVILTMTMTMFTSIAIVRERERGNMELLIATPVKTVELMTGKLIPYVIIGLIQTLIILLLGQQLFDVPIVGSLSLILLVCTVFIFANLGFGLLLSTLAKNQLAAMQMFIFFFLPSLLLSGFMFPFVAMPKVAQWLAEILPMTHFMRIIRAVILRGAELSDIHSDMMFLVGFFIVTMLLALLRFKQRLD
ncbi:putative multidrug ABC transporter permease YbhS [Sinobacterium norvegicum]|uniref:Transport permease protein n=1 Tax=Sinobacterium norvegicum TaxID=1641715 RepID=A0ABN8EIC5_9GAMM|nr:ABC transporter permease [Sinobacterium norvegicum]CAH0992129.1 putative multidrug ABC transporter permease YbhS [Sinobacterium norvegicum]